MVSAWKRAIAHTIVIYILIAGKPAEPCQVLCTQYLAAIEWFIWISKWRGHPVIHAEIEVGHDKDRCLQLFSKVERCLGHLVAFVNTARN